MHLEPRRYLIAAPAPPPSRRALSARGPKPGRGGLSAHGFVPALASADGRLGGVPDLAGLWNRRPGRLEGPQDAPERFSGTLRAVGSPRIDDLGFPRGMGRVETGPLGGLVDDGRLGVLFQEAASARRPAIIPRSLTNTIELSPSPHLPRRIEDLHGAATQRHPVLAGGLHPACRNSPDTGVPIRLAPHRDPRARACRPAILSGTLGRCAEVEMLT